MKQGNERKKRKLVKLGAFLVTFLMLFTIFPSVAASTNYYSSDDITYIQAWEELDGITYYQLNNIIIEERGMEFAQNYFAAIDALYAFVTALPQTRAGDTIFPSDFGGAYIDDDGNAVLLMVSQPFSRVQTAESLVQLQRADSVLVREVLFSYSYLWGLIDSLNSFSYSDPDTLVDIGVKGWYLDVINNNVGVQLTNITNDAIDAFMSNVINSAAIVFEQHIGYNTANSGTLGGRLRVYRNGAYIGSSSIGFRASLGGVRGFITTAHADAAGGRLRLDDQFRVLGIANPIGSIVSATHVALDGADAAFVTLNAGFEIPNSIENTPVTSSHVPHIFVGQYVFSVGFASGARAGVVTRIGYRALLRVPGHPTFTILNTIRTSYSGRIGDSGGIVVTNGASPLQVIGIHLGIHNEGGSITSNFNEINRWLGTSLR